MPPILYVILGLLSIIWGGSFFFIKVLLESYGPWSIAFLRCLFGVLALAVVLLIRREKLQLKQGPWKAFVLVGLLNSAVPWALIGYSETRISSSLASVLNASTPIWTLLLGFLFFRLSTTRYQWIGIMTGFLGILILADIEWTKFKINDPWGFSAMLLVTFCYGWAAQISRRHFQTISVYQISFITLSIGTIVSGIFAVFIESPQWDHLLEQGVFWSLIGLGVFGSGIAYILFFYLIQKGSAEFATTVTYLVPPFAILWGSTFLNEKIPVSLLVGLSLILFGVFIIGHKKREKVEVKALS
jgi:drug/metabolite transporter (DMT)-like permease